MLKNPNQASDNDLFIAELMILNVILKLRVSFQSDQITQIMQKRNASSCVFFLLDFVLISRHKRAPEGATGQRKTEGYIRWTTTSKLPWNVEPGDPAGKLDALMDRLLRSRRRHEAAVAPLRRNTQLGFSVRHNVIERRKISRSCFFKALREKTAVGWKKVRRSRGDPG